MATLNNIYFKSRDKFFYYVDQCNRLYRHSDDLSLYREIIQLHRENDLNTLIESDKFHDLIYKTLCSWDMDKRQAKLRESENIKKSIKFYKKQLIELSKHSIFSIPSIGEYYFPPSNEKELIGYDVLENLQKLFCNLEVMESERRIVGVSKTLHFLLPDLVMPIDGTYTMIWFFNHNVSVNGPRNEFNKIFKPIFIEVYKEIKTLKLNQDSVDGIGWNMSVPKLYDNAIIGFAKSTKSVQVNQ